MWFPSFISSLTNEDERYLHNGSEEKAFSQICRIKRDTEGGGVLPQKDSISFFSTSYPGTHHASYAGLQLMGKAPVPDSQVLSL